MLYCARNHFSQKRHCHSQKYNFIVFVNCTGTEARRSGSEYSDWEENGNEYRNKYRNNLEWELTDGGGREL